MLALYERGPRVRKPEDAYTNAFLAVRDLVHGTVDTAAFYAKPRRMSAIWSGHIVPLITPEMTLFEDTQVNLYLNSTLGSCATLATVALVDDTGTVVRGYSLNPETMPEELNERTSLNDEWIWTALESGVVFDTAWAYRLGDGVSERERELQLQNQPFAVD